MNKQIDKAHLNQAEPEVSELPEWKSPGDAHPFLLQSLLTPSLLLAQQNAHSRSRELRFIQQTELRT